MQKIGNIQWKIIGVNILLITVFLTFYVVFVNWFMPIPEIISMLLQVAALAPVLMFILSLLTFLFFRPLQKYIDARQRGEDLGEEAFFKARKTSLRFTVYIIIANCIAFGLGPLISSIVQLAAGTYEYDMITWSIGIFSGFATGFFVGVITFFSANHITAGARLALNMHRIHREKNERFFPFRYKALLVMGGICLLLISYSMVQIKYHEGYMMQRQKEISRQIQEKPQLLEDDQALDEFLARNYSSSRLDFGILYFIVMGLVYSLLIWALLSGDTVKQVKLLTERVCSMLGNKKDLSTRMNLIDFDETGELVEALNDFLDGIKDIVYNVKTVFKEVLDSGQSISAAINQSDVILKELSESVRNIDQKAHLQEDELSKSQKLIHKVIDSFEEVVSEINNQTHEVENTSSGIEEIAASIETVAQSAGKSVDIAEELNSHAEKGNHSVQESVQSIQGMEEFADKVSKAVSVINVIAAQTNLLAMNAAIEAAHAGEYGRGFAVVAIEIRKLAEDSSQSAKQIMGYIKEMQLRVKDTVKLSEEAGSALDSILQGVRDTNGLIKAISQAISEQKEASCDILTSSTRMVASTRQVREKTLEERKDNEASVEMMDRAVKASADTLANVDTQKEYNETLKQAVNQIKNHSDMNRQVVSRLEEVLEAFILE